MRFLFLSLLLFSISSCSTVVEDEEIKVRHELVTSSEYMSTWGGWRNPYCSPSPPGKYSSRNDCLASAEMRAANNYYKEGRRYIIAKIGETATCVQMQGRKDWEVLSGGTVYFDERECKLSGDVEKINSDLKIKNELFQKEKKLAMQKRFSSFTGKSTRNWSYEKVKDKMTGKYTYFARNISKNSVNLRFPYEGNRKLIVELMMTEDEGRLVFVYTSLNSANYESSTIRAKFDSSLKYLSGNSVQRGPKSVIMLDLYDGVTFHDDIKRAKKMQIGVSFFGHGEEIFDFDLHGLHDLFAYEDPSRKTEGESDIFRSSDFSSSQ